MTPAEVFTVAQAGTESFRTIEFDLPESTAGILALVLGLSLLFTVTFWTSLRDSRFLTPVWRGGLLLLRVAVLTLILAVLLNPRERTQTTQIQRSRVGVLVDTSLSMAYPAAESTGNSDSTESRAEAVRAALIDSGVLDQLSQTHSVSVYSFSSELSDSRAVVANGAVSFVDHPLPSSLQDDVARMDLDDGSELTASEILTRWTQILQPAGAETRLGESLHQLIGQLTGPTLSGIVVVTDGRSNAGLDVEVARSRAERSETRLVLAGVGSDRPQINVWVAGMQSPSDVHRGDPFDISVTIQGSGVDQQLSGCV